MVDFPVRLHYDILEDLVTKARPPRIKFHVYQVFGTDQARGNILHIEEIHLEIYNEFIDVFLDKLHGVQFGTKSLVILATMDRLISSTAFTQLVCIPHAIKQSSILALY